MTISVICEACGKIYSLKVEAAGETFVCQACGAEVDVPGGSEPEPAPTVGVNLTPRPSPTPLPRPSVGPNDAALARVKLPAIFMMIIAGISCITQPMAMIGQSAGVAWLFKAGDTEGWALVAGGSGGLVFLGLCLIASIIALVGAWKMKNLRAYGFSVTAMLIGTFPCMFICCSMSFPIGIWGLVVLNNANVKAAFRSSR